MSCITRGTDEADEPDEGVTPMTTSELAGRTALVTGGAQGLGRKFAEFLTEIGRAHV